MLMTIIAEYKASPEFARLAQSTRRSYSLYIKLIEDAFGDLPLAALANRRVRGEFKTWRDGFAATPRKADFAWTFTRPHHVLCQGPRLDHYQPLRKRWAPLYG
jgi:hypothetical protein